MVSAASVQPLASARCLIKKIRLELPLSQSLFSEVMVILHVYPTCACWKNSVGSLSLGLLSDSPWTSLFAAKSALPVWVCGMSYTGLPMSQGSHKRACPRSEHPCLLKRGPCMVKPLRSRAPAGVAGEPGAGWLFSLLRHSQPGIQGPL